MPLFSILFALIVIGLLFWAITRLLAAFGLGEPIATVVRVLFVVIVVFWLLSLLGVGPGLRLR